MKGQQAFGEVGDPRPNVFLIVSVIPSVFHFLFNLTSISSRIISSFIKDSSLFMVRSWYGVSVSVNKSDSFLRFDCFIM